MLLPCSQLPASRRALIRSNRNLAVWMWVTLWVCVSLFLLIFRNASINFGSSFFSPHPRAWLRTLSCLVSWWILMSSAVSNWKFSLMLWPRQNPPPSPSTSSVSFPTSHYFHYHLGWFNENRDVKKGEFTSLHILREKCVEEWLIYKNKKKHWNSW